MESVGPLFTSRHRSGVVVAAACAAVGIAPLPAHAAKQLPLRPMGMNEPLTNERLSDERRLTRYAQANSRARVYLAARDGSRTITRLRYRTEDGPPEVYLVLRSHVDPEGRTWVKIRVPKRPNGQKGWVRRDALGQFVAVRTSLIISRRTLRATLYRNGRTIWQSRIGVGAARTPTPAGRFWVRNRLRDLRGGTIYGPWAFGTAAYSVLSEWPGGGVIGIHGTNEPQLIPGRPSRGCIRVPNPKIRRLARLMPIGTPVRIL